MAPPGKNRVLCYLLFFVIFGRFNGLQHLAAAMNVRTEALSGGDSDEQGPNPAAGLIG
jgi:hypothetical protein